MSEPTQIAPTGDGPVFSQMTPELRALDLLHAKYGKGDMPAPYITIHGLVRELALQLPTLAAFEMWREELGISPDVVTLRGSEQPWLEASGQYAGTTVALSVHFPAAVSSAAQGVSA
ncbi:hypothetical protein [Streptomyces sp. URMC 129]|uniref:hypothetical protein n=1 Tax=Streptomyces sp. URMC 129 TaxID=3423407 RepID=UPI003F1CC49F